MLKALAMLFVVSIFVPVEFYVMLGSVRMELYRLVLAAALVYAVVDFQNTLRQADLVDLLLVGLTGCVFTSFWFNHDLQKAVESTGIYALETLGAFYLARGFIVSPLRFYQIHIGFVVTLSVLSVFTVYESFSQHRILHDLARDLTGHEALDPRLYTQDYVRSGLMRAANLFEHPILYGTLTAMFFPFVVLLAWRSRRWRWVTSSVALSVSMLLTLSSAPLLSLIFQVLTAMLVRFWHHARALWLALLSGGLALSVLVSLLSNRGVFGILIFYLTFNPNTGYFRILQWQYTADDIAASPLLGIGHHDWTRPYWMEWMGNSIDSFWLLLILQHGVFALLMVLIASFYAVFSTLNRVHLHHEQHRWMISAWLLAFLSLILIGFTVDYFGKLQPMFFFMLGAIGWARYYPLWNQQAESLTSDLNLNNMPVQPTTDNHTP